MITLLWYTRPNGIGVSQAGDTAEMGTFRVAACGVVVLVDHIVTLGRVQNESLNDWGGPWRPSFLPFSVCPLACAGSASSRTDGGSAR